MELQQNLNRFQRLGARLVALSADNLENAQTVANEKSLEFNVLSDPARLTIRAYGVESGQIAKPAVFVIDSSGVVAWKYVGADKADRPSVNAILDQVRPLQPTPKGRTP